VPNRVDSTLFLDKAIQKAKDRNLIISSFMKKNIKFKSSHKRSRFGVGEDKNCLSNGDINKDEFSSDSSEHNRREVNSNSRRSNNPRILKFFRNRAASRKESFKQNELYSTI
jgi:hypothetical protein